MFSNLLSLSKAVPELANDFNEIQRVTNIAIGVLSLILFIFTTFIFLLKSSANVKLKKARLIDIYVSLAILLTPAIVFKFLTLSKPKITYDIVKVESYVPMYSEIGDMRNVYRISITGSKTTNSCFYLGIGTLFEEFYIERNQKIDLIYTVADPETFEFEPIFGGCLTKNVLNHSSFKEATSENIAELIADSFRRTEDNYYKITNKRVYFNFKKGEDGSYYQVVTDYNEKHFMVDQYGKWHRLSEYDPYENIW